MTPQQKFEKVLDDIDEEIKNQPKGNLVFINPDPTIQHLFNGYYLVKNKNSILQFSVDKDGRILPLNGGYKISIVSKKYFLHKYFLKRKHGYKKLNKR